MPANKNAVIRYKHLDELLSDRHHLYSRAELMAKVNAKLASDGYSTVTKRTIEYDLLALTEIFGVEYDDNRVENYIRYEDPAFSIFTKELTEDERVLLKSVLDTVGQFKGLPNFEWLEQLKEKLEHGERTAFERGAGEMPVQRKIIEFSNNPHYVIDSNIFATLFSAIAHKQALRLTYQKFDAETPKTFLVSPYRLKEFNNRWFLVCLAADRHRLYFLPLERIRAYEVAVSEPFKECPVDLDDYSGEVIGVTNHEGKPLEEIIFAVCPAVYPYIATKPLHGSQICPPEDEQEHLHAEYADVPADWTFLCLKVKVNPELITLLFSFADGLVVVRPESVRNRILEKMQGMQKRYPEAEDARKKVSQK
ncbi:MAG: WYL domain-containing protein [Bacteroidales bacterium]|jgi:predicted DNA-binding transcriptional regulator YafY|nr:WYL domain-containing protein [Bacteroidota bacterium]NLN99364.1 WYL domain-containing protein [Bacteroidales bacterium]